MSLTGDLGDIADSGLVDKDLQNFLLQEQQKAQFHAQVRPQKPSWSTLADQAAATDFSAFFRIFYFFLLLLGS